MVTEFRFVIAVPSHAVGPIAVAVQEYGVEHGCAKLLDFSTNRSQFVGPWEWVESKI